jgi:GNAT superfamily N-acetyltransferase
MATLGYPLPAPVLGERIRELGALDPAGTILVATRESVILGFATLHATPVLHRPTAVGRITGLAVTPGAQGTGVGRALVAAAEQCFADLGLSRIEVTSGPTHLTAHEFYRHLGYEDQGLRFAKPLVPRPDGG